MSEETVAAGSEWRCWPDGTLMSRLDERTGEELVSLVPGVRYREGSVLIRQGARDMQVYLLEPASPGRSACVKVTACLAPPGGLARSRADDHRTPGLGRPPPPELRRARRPGALREPDFRLVAVAVQECSAEAWLRVPGLRPDELVVDRATVTAGDAAGDLPGPPGEAGVPCGGRDAGATPLRML